MVIIAEGELETHAMETPSGSLVGRVWGALPNGRLAAPMSKAERERLSQPRRSPLDLYNEPSTFVRISTLYVDPQTASGYSDTFTVDETAQTFSSSGDTAHAQASLGFAFGPPTSGDSSSPPAWGSAMIGGRVRTTDDEEVAKSGAVPRFAAVGTSAIRREGAGASSRQSTLEVEGDGTVEVVSTTSSAGECVGIKGGGEDEEVGDGIVSGDTIFGARFGGSEELALMAATAQQASVAISNMGWGSGGGQSSVSPSFHAFFGKSTHHPAWLAPDANLFAPASPSDPSRDAHREANVGAGGVVMSGGRWGSLATEDVGESIPDIELGESVGWLFSSASRTPIREAVAESPVLRVGDDTATGGGVSSASAPRVGDPVAVGPWSIGDVGESIPDIELGESVGWLFSSASRTPIREEQGVSRTPVRRSADPTADGVSLPVATKLASTGFAMWRWSLQGAVKTIVEAVSMFSSRRQAKHLGAGWRNPGAPLYRRDHTVVIDEEWGSRRNRATMLDTY